jgi:hypothetical protein
MQDEFSCAIATYKGAIKSFFVAIATQLDIPTSIESDGDKPPKPMSRPLAKVANDRHNLAQIARNCRYQQLN